MADITMPQLGETVTEGTITKWMKKVGDAVAEDEVLFEVSTDKVDSEVPSPASGYLAEILVQEGETVDVGAKLAVISDAPSGNGGAPAPAAEAAPAAPAAPAAAAPASEAPAPAEPAAAPSDGQGDAAAKAVEAEQAGTPEPELPADTAAAVAPEQQPGQGDSPSKAAAPAAAPSASTPAPSGAADEADDEDGGAAGADGMSKVLSPVVRRLISEHGLDPATIKGTGAGGRITRSDVLALVEDKGGGAAPSAPAAAPAPAASAPAASTPAAAAPPAQPQPQAASATAPAPAAPAPAPAPAAAAPAARAGDRDEVIPFSRIRKVTAEHMVRSKATSAHTLVAIEVDYEGIDKVRAAVKDHFKAEEGVSLTYLPFISRATVDAIREFPRINASVGNDELIVHHYVNLGIAVDLNFEGLLVPVVREADTKRLRAIAREIADLATRARTKKLSADELAGGTFTITNAGGYGTMLTGPVINQPQIAILSTDGVKKRPVVVELPDGTDAIAIHPTGNLALTWDHRAVDGAYAAAFLARIKEILETRDWSQEL